MIRSRFSADHWVSWAVVLGSHKLVANNDLSHVELYDLAADPLEQTHITETQAETAASLLEAIQDWQETLPAKPSGDVFSSERSA